MKNAITSFFKSICFLLFVIYCNHSYAAPVIIARHASMPSVAYVQGIMYVAFTQGDSLLITSSSNAGKTFGQPQLISTIKNLLGTAGRGPQIAVTQYGISILAPDKAGNIYAFAKTGNGKWQQTGKVNDVDEVAKEGFVSLASNGKALYAVWLDLRNNQKNKIVGSKSSDGGKTWAANKVIYQSPEGTVCECCKPSVAFKGADVYVIFRNYIKGNRDLYTIKSGDGGNSFGAAEKLGNGSWALNACPMDGGGIAVDDSGNLQTVWRRQSAIYSCTQGKPEVQLGEGKNCGIENVNGLNIYTWVEKGEVVCLLPGNKKLVQGKGILPVLKAVDNKQAVCIWQNEQNIYCSSFQL